MGSIGLHSTVLPTCRYCCYGWWVLWTSLVLYPAVGSLVGVGVGLGHGTFDSLVVEFPIPLLIVLISGVVHFILQSPTPLLNQFCWFNSPGWGGVRSWLGWGFPHRFVCSPCADIVHIARAWFCCVVIWYMWLLFVVFIFVVISSMVNRQGVRRLGQKKRVVRCTLWPPTLWFPTFSSSPGHYRSCCHLHCSYPHRHQGHCSCSCHCHHSYLLSLSSLSSSLLLPALSSSMLLPSLLSPSLPSL